MLVDNIDKIHTTELGLIRIERNLNVSNGVEFCKKIILDSKTNIYRKGKNYFCEYEDVVITVNSYSYTIITAKRK